MHEKPAVCLSCVVNVAWQQQWRGEVTLGKAGAAWHCSHGAHCSCSCNCLIAAMQSGNVD